MEPVRSQEEVASLYERHVDMVYHLCLMLMKNVPDAEDAVQTVFRKVMEYDKPFHDPEHERAWLIVTARNECRNQLKHWWRTRRESEEVLNSLTWEQPDGPLSPLLPGLHRPGDGGDFGKKSLHHPGLAVPGQKEAEKIAGGGYR